MNITRTCTKYLLEAVLAVAPIAMMCGAVGVRPESTELKTAQNAIEDVGQIMGKVQKEKSNMEAKLVTPPRSTNVITR